MKFANQEHRRPEWHRTHLRRTARFAVALAMMIGAGLTAATAPAQAAIPNTLVSEHTSKCLADFFDGGPSTVPCVTGGVGQEWEPLTIYPQQLRNTHTQRCLQDAFAGGPGTVPCDGTAPVADLQLWR